MMNEKASKRSVTIRLMPIGGLASSRGPGPPDQAPEDPAGERTFAGQECRHTDTPESRVTRILFAANV
jgi:hypothetical protein